MNNTNRQIHLGFYSTSAEKIIKSLLDKAQVSLSGAKNTVKIKGMKHLELIRADDNELVFNCRSDSSWRHESTWCGMSENDILNHIAWTLKCQVIDLLRKDGHSEEWNRNSTATVQIGENIIAVAAFYCIYDNLRRRRNSDRRYPKELVDELRGQPLDPILTEMKIAQREELKRIDDELQMKLTSLDNEFYEAKNHAIDELRKKYDGLKDEAREAAIAAKKQVKDASLAFTTAA